MNNQGNPVPSLDEVDIRFIINELKHIRNSGICGALRKRYIDTLISKLQNGVETNKEQPKTSADYNDNNKYIGPNCIYRGGDCNCSLSEMGSYCN